MLPNSDSPDNTRELWYQLPHEYRLIYDNLSKVQKKNPILCITDISIKDKNIQHLQIFLDILPLIKQGLPHYNNMYLVILLPPELQYIKETLKRNHWKTKSIPYTKQEIAIYQL